MWCAMLALAPDCGVRWGGMGARTGTMAFTSTCMLMLVQCIM